MTKKRFQYIYGPVLSRRLGRSLGVDLVPYKTCTYDCIYCHLGRTTNKTVERKEYVAVDAVFEELKRKLDEGPAPDYISLAGSGEPTLNSRIGHLIEKIKKLTSIPVVVLTNASLLWMPKVRAALMNADLVIPSLDAGDESLFQHVNRPHKKIAFQSMVDGLAEFTEKFHGAIWLEVFLIAGMTGLPFEAVKIAALTERIRPQRVQLNTVCRPPAEDFAFPLSNAQMQILRTMFPQPADIISEQAQRDRPPDTLLNPGVEDMLSLLRRRPCTLEDVSDGLGMHMMEAIKLLDTLIVAGRITAVPVGGQRFYVATGSGRTSRS
jgi:wyosine [tRNA(Phe)-imidazoG37] synthetase (radical SAM superfamily)